MYGLQPGDRIRFVHSGKEYQVINVTISRVLVANEREKFAIPQAQLRKQINRKEMELLYEND